MMMIKPVIKSSVCGFFSLTCFLLAVFSGLPVFAKIILEVTDRFFFFNFPRISNRSAEPLDGIQHGAGGRRGERSLETKPAALKHTELAD